MVEDAENSSPAPLPPRRRYRLSALLAALAIGGSAVGVFIYQMMQGNRASSVDATGFDVSQTSESKPAAGSAVIPQAQSSLGMVKTGLPGMQFGAKGGADAGPAAQQAAKPTQQEANKFKELCVKNEPKVRAFSEQWTKKSPVLQQYGKDWMSYPDLKKLNDDYMRNHDPVAFMRGLAKSDNFPKMVKKYANEPIMAQFVQTGAKQVPMELFNSGMSYVNQDNIVKQMVDKVVQSMGLSPAVLGSAPGGGQVDAGKVMDSVLGNNPQIKKALESNPEIQQQIQNATRQ